jgi:SHS2 domain-containing protein
MARYELFDHTADLGIRVFAATRAELVPLAAEALYAAIGELRPAGDPRPILVEFHGEDAAVLLRDFLSELLYAFEQERRMMTSIQIAEFSASRMAVTGESREVDETASVLMREVKAVTYHELALREFAEGVEFTCIVDI